MIPQRESIGFRNCPSILPFLQLKLDLITRYSDNWDSWTTLVWSHIWLLLLKLCKWMGDQFHEGHGFHSFFTCKFYPFEQIKWVDVGCTFFLTRIARAGKLVSMFCKSIVHSIQNHLLEYLCTRVHMALHVPLNLDFLRPPFWWQLRITERFFSFDFGSEFSSPPKHQKLQIWRVWHIVFKAMRSYQSNN